MIVRKNKIVLEEMRPSEPHVITAHEVAEQGDIMRRLQRSYFLTRDRETLKKAKHAEAKFDALVASVLRAGPNGCCRVEVDANDVEAEEST